VKSLRRLVDTHAHLSDLEDKEGVAQRARKEGVDAIIAVGANLTTSRATMAWAEACPGYVYPALGIHPTEWAEDCISETLQYIRDSVNEAVAIGEIGLDYWEREARKNKDVREKQRQIYTRMLEIAREYDKPVSVHGRGSWRDVLNLASEHGPKWAVFHWYSGPIDVLGGILDHGYFISATPAAEYSRDHRAALAQAPLDRIVIETDAPVYMRNRDRNSEPSDLPITVRALTRLKDTAVDEVARVTTKNAERIFGI